MVPRSGGYVLAVEPVAVDLYLFRDLRARSATDERAEESLVEAVGCGGVRR